jgi:hypothetical protein
MLSAGLLMLMLHKPPCNKDRHTELWPEVANKDKNTLQVLARAGTLEMCVASDWGYKWTHLTVNIHQPPVKRKTP